MPFKGHRGTRGCRFRVENRSTNTPPPTKRISSWQGRPAVHPPQARGRNPGLAHSLPGGPCLLMRVSMGKSICTPAVHAHAHTQNHAPSNPSVSESRLSEMKVQSPGTESQPSKNVPFSQTEETCRGGVCFTASPGGLGPSPPRPAPSCKAGFQMQPAGLLPGLPPAHSPSLQEREGPALESPRQFRRGMPLSTPPPPPLRHHIFTFGCFFFPFFPCQENQALAPAPDLPPTLN